MAGSVCESAKVVGKTDDYVATFNALVNRVCQKPITVGDTQQSELAKEA